MPRLGEATAEMELLPVILYTSSYSWTWSGLPYILKIPVFGLVKANTFRLKLIHQLVGLSAGTGSSSSAEPAWQSLKRSFHELRNTLGRVSMSKHHFQARQEHVDQQTLTGQAALSLPGGLSTARSIQVRSSISPHVLTGHSRAETSLSDSELSQTITGCCLARGTLIGFSLLACPSSVAVAFC